MSEMTVEEMKQKIETENQKKGAECMGKINALLDKYGMALVGMPVFTPDGRVAVKVVITPKQEVENG